MDDSGYPRRSDKLELPRHKDLHWKLACASARRAETFRIFALASLCLISTEGRRLGAQTVGDATRPSYTAASVVNAATQTVSGLAPNTIATVYGSNLAYTTVGVKPSDTPGGIMPANLAGVEVYVNRYRTALFYVSPTQINFLVPPELRSGDFELQIARVSINGPPVIVHLDDFAPGFFVWQASAGFSAIIATHADGTLITQDAPAARGEVIVLYATGLGPTSPLQYSLNIPSRASPLAKTSLLQVEFNGVAISASNILYAGITPGCTGLYQINLRVPSDSGAVPSVTIRFGSIVSPAASLASVKI